MHLIATLPPLPPSPTPAVGLRFGIGRDFFLNCFFCILGYIPSHFHNFYIQNIRNNTGRGRTPKWAKKAGIVDDHDDKRRALKSQWAKRYDERNTRSTLEDAELAEGEEGDNYRPLSELTEREVARRKQAGLWTREDEEYYNEEHTNGGRDGEAAPNQKHWHYPANFEGTDLVDGNGEIGEDPQDRWDRTAAARAEYDPVKPSLFGHKNKKGKKSKASTGTSRFDAYAPEGNEYGNGNEVERQRTGNALDAAYDDDVPEWGKDYGAPTPKSGKKASTVATVAGGRGRSTTGDSSSYAPSSVYGAGAAAQNGNGNGNGNGGFIQPNGNGNANVGRTGGGRSEAEENWDHQF